MRTFQLAAVFCLLRSLVVCPSIQAGDLETVRGRFIHSVLPPAGAQADGLRTAAIKLVDTQKPDGTWADINYADKSRSGWLTSKHLNNLLQIAKANAASPDAGMKGSLLRGIDWWLTHDPHNPNWWHNEIGVPQLLGETAMIMGDDLADAQRSRVIAVMNRSVWTKWTGQNLVWGVGNQVVRGILQGDEQTVAAAYKRLYEEIRLEKPQGEGIMPDASFHQHGSQLYSGGYGLGFANDVGRFIGYAWGTACQVPADKMAIYTNYLLDGEQWMIRGTTFDYSATGRELTRKGKSAVPPDWSNGPVTPVGAAYGLGNTLTTLAGLDVPRRQELQAFVERLAGRSPPLNGNRYFWCSDYMVHQRPTFFASVRMYSSRLIPSELINSEGLQSHHLADGCTLLYRTGDEYRDIFAAWDWKKIPGTTAEQFELTPSVEEIRKKGTTDFVGGVSDETSGLCAQDLKRGQLTARKFWLLFDDGLAALGTGIHCDSDTPVITSIDQRLLRGDVSRSDHFVRHDGFTYTILSPDKFDLTAGTQMGKWSDIGTGSTEPDTRQVFNLWIDHGVKPKDASYAYVIRDGPEGTPQLEILSNTPALQAVFHSKLKLLGVAFWQGGKLEAGGQTVEVDQPCLVMIREGKISVSNPKNAALTVNVRANGAGPIQFNLPGGALAGSTVTHDQ